MPNPPPDGARLYVLDRGGGGMNAPQDRARLYVPDRGGGGMSAHPPMVLGCTYLTEGAEG